MRIALRAVCIQDLKDARDWYEKERPGLGVEFRKAMARTLEVIREHPLRFRVLVGDVRQALVRKFPYRVLYRIDGDTIRVVACYHGHRDPCLWTERE